MSPTFPIADAYQEAAQRFLTTVEVIGPQDWSKAGLGDWTVRDLVGHTARALTLVRTYRLDTSTGQLLSALDYYVAAFASLGDPAAVAQRGRDAGTALGDDPAATVQGEYEETMRALHEIDYIKTPVGEMAINEYLRTRIVELVVHTNDVQRAIGRPLTCGEASGVLAFELLGALAMRTEKGPAVLAALTGRQALPDGFSLF